MSRAPHRAPFAYYGGKSRIAGEVWRRIGDVPHFVEPFFGSGAVLLARPHRPRVETANDANGYLANFWRAVASAPSEVAQWSDWPFSEADLHARHDWLRAAGKTLIAKVTSDPEYFDPKVAGWWWWGISQWLWNGWCEPVPERPAGSDDEPPRLSHGGGGLTGNFSGAHARGTDPWARLAILQRRLRKVRFLCGDFLRALKPGITVNRWPVTGVFLDPPYDQSVRKERIYLVDESGVALRARRWCLEAGDDPKLRICLAGFEGEHAELEDHGWSVWHWNRSNGSGDEVSRREALWFSPHCLSPTHWWRVPGGLWDRQEVPRA